MISKKDAIAIGKSYCDALKREQDNNTGQTVVGTEAPRDEKQSNRVYGARGVANYAMDNLWHDVLPVKVREAFEYNQDAFRKECGWPD